MAKKITIINDSAVRACEGSFKIIMKEKVKGKFFIETTDGIIALDNSKGKMRYKERLTLSECIDFFNKV